MMRSLGLHWLAILFVACFLEEVAATITTTTTTPSPSRALQGDTEFFDELKDENNDEDPFTAKSVLLIMLVFVPVLWCCARATSVVLSRSRSTAIAQSPEDDEERQARVKKQLEELHGKLETTTMKIHEDDILPPTPDVERGEAVSPKEESAKTASEATKPLGEEEKTKDPLAAGLDQQAESSVRLPADGLNGSRTVAGSCAICLSSYQPGEKLTWSPHQPTENDKKEGADQGCCTHAFHTTCLVEHATAVLEKAPADEILCPLCRRPFVQLTPPTTSSSNNDNNNTTTSDTNVAPASEEDGVGTPSTTADATTATPDEEDAPNTVNAESSVPATVDPSPNTPTESKPPGSTPTDSPTTSPETTV